MYNVWYYAYTFKMKLHNCIEKKVNIVFARITRFNNVCLCYVPISDDTSIKIPHIIREFLQEL